MIGRERHYEYGLTHGNLEDIMFRAKTKEDGCYRCSYGIAYRVRAGKIAHLAFEGKIMKPRFWLWWSVMDEYEPRDTGTALNKLELI